LRTGNIEIRDILSLNRRDKSCMKYKRREPGKRRLKREQE